MTLFPSFLLYGASFGVKSLSLFTLIPEDVFETQKEDGIVLTVNMLLNKKLRQKV